jgi:hypothetical protein
MGALFAQDYGIFYRRAWSFKASRIGLAVSAQHRSVADVHIAVAEHAVVSVHHAPLKQSRDDTAPDTVGRSHRELHRQLVAANRTPKGLQYEVYFYAKMNEPARLCSVLRV